MHSPRFQLSSYQFPGKSFFQNLCIPISRKFELYSVCSIFLLFIVYNLTISPAIYWSDSPEFSNTSFNLAIGHPAGFPAYSLISKFFAFFPFSDIAVKANYVSLFFAVFTELLVFFIIVDLIKLCFGEINRDQSYLSAAIGTLFLGFAGSFWQMASTAEMYQLNCFLIASFFLVILKWYRYSEPKFIFLAAFILGISAAVYGANLLFLPPLIVSYFLSKDENPFKKLFLSSAFFLIGYSVYIYLPVRSLTNPAFDWGNPETFERFVAHITDRKDSGEHFSGMKDIFLFYKNILMFFQIMIKEMTFIGLFFTITGLICHFKKKRKSFYSFALVGLVNTLFFITYLTDVPSDRGYLFLVSFLIVTFWIGLGIYVLIAEGRGYFFSFRYTNLILPLAIVFLIFSFSKDYVHNNKSSFHLPRDHAAEMLLDVDPNTIIFTYGYYSHFRYLKDVEFLRPDVIIVLLSDIIRPDLFDQVNQEKFPMINFPSIESKSENQHEFIQLLIQENINNRPIYWDFKTDLTKYNYQYLVPGSKFLMRMSGQKIDKIPEELLGKYFLKLRNSMMRELSDKHFFLDQSLGARSYYYTFITNFVDYLMKRKMYRSALSFLELAASISEPGDENILTLKGLCYMHSGDLKRAENIFVKLHKNNKESFGYNHDLALLYFLKNDLEKSKSFLKYAIKLNQEFIRSYFLLGLIYEKEGDYNEAIKEITYAIKKTNFVPEIKNMQEALDRVKKLKAEKDN
tara:strand:- start:14232 stop:16451 length:2220 start_codon:yes stop_codon:yes gene_type:complete